ncbi:flagellin [Paenalkalicoccus suaedae]|uniref:Flagellin n=1 Tax=Paenalkalicoccus suaedae TaxID=2592382 RepID=A0A859FH72_9BACI|nr:flagellin [Paenalkalicoccus suaedae]QKS72411.1 flagellin [Paenalkalicoccus suaedae]
MMNNASFMLGTTRNNVDLYKNMIKISSSDRLFRAAQNAASLGISENMRSQIRGNSVTARNISDSQSLIRTADGALGSSHDILQRMRQLSVQANNGTLTESDRGILQREFDGLRETIDSIGRNTQFNTQPLLDGTFTNKQTAGSNGTILSTSIPSSLSEDLGLASIDLRSNPQAALSLIDHSISQLSDRRSTLGATDNRLNYAGSLAQTMLLQTTNAESRIRDTDIAKAITDHHQYMLMYQAKLSAQKLGIGMSGMAIQLLA